MARPAILRPGCKRTASESDDVPLVEPGIRLEIFEFYQLCDSENPYRLAFSNSSLKSVSMVSRFSLLY